MSIQIPSLKVQNIEFHVLNMHTRFPFQYGIASLTAIPHLFLKATVHLEGVGTVVGITSEGLPPKWFTKDPATRFEEDLPLFFEVIQYAADTATNSASGSFFELWKKLYDHQNSHNWSPGVAPLLANLGVALVERAVMDALCRGLQTNLHSVLRDNRVGIDFEEVRSELTGMQMQDIISEVPRSSVHVRHTVGLGDLLTVEDVPDGEELQDGLPYTLEENILQYGLTYFKIKVRGDLEADLERVRKIVGVLKSTSVMQPQFTLDGNEQFQSLEGFQEFYEACCQDEDVRQFFDEGLLFIEQPLHRIVALEKDLTTWKERPPIVLDESDGDLSSLPTALELGYQGCSHKNCKGLVKSLANAALLKKHKQEDPAGTYLLSGEDLANVGPIALNQDLAMVASLGVTHVERNGHHYFQGLSMFPEDLWPKISEPGLYHAYPQGGFPTMDIQQGCLNLKHLVEAPFGATTLLDTSRFTKLADWSAGSLG